MIYYCDFRGRKYPSTAYLHEQGSDLARGLLLRADKKPIGEAGFFWLMVSIASNWAGDAGRPDGAKSDKIPLKDRYEWALLNEETFLLYAESPKTNQGWMKADKPWQFLAACFELMNLRVWQVTHTREKIQSDGVIFLTDPDFNNFSYESHLECYVDGSNNGSQHLSALTRDEITAPLVNLVPLDMPGDLYKYVGDHVWKKITSAVEEMSEENKQKCEEFIDRLIELKKRIHATDYKSEERAALVAEIKKFKDDNLEISKMSSIVFWNRVTDPKHKRKIVKRNTMTLPYGGTPYGLGEQQISDARKHGIELLNFMEYRWGASLGREVFDDCKDSLKRPMRLLSVFEAAGAAAEARNEFLKWTVPVTNFPVVQNYTEGTVKRVYVQYGPKKGLVSSTGHFDNTLQLMVCFIEDQQPSKGKQAQGASPNCIHSLDAAHLMLTVHKCDFPVTTIHDSFGCLLSDMPVLFKTVRETFVELYLSNPLEHLMKDIQGDISAVEIGNLDINLVIESEYCFA